VGRGASATTDSSIADAANAVNLPSFDIRGPYALGNTIRAASMFANYDHKGLNDAGPKPRAFVCVRFNG
jgi:hypothetical protein